MDRSHAYVPENILEAPRGASPLGPQLRELRRVLKAVRAGDTSARVDVSREGPLAEIGEALNEIVEHHGRTHDRVRALELELAAIANYRSEFLANVSHELRTPLNNLLILSGTLSKNKSRNLDEDQVSYAATIYECGRDLLRMINDMLDLGHVDARRSELPETRPRDLVADLEQFFRPLASEKGLGFALSIGHEVPTTVRIDSDRVQQILYNLLSNAFKFTEKGDVTVTVTMADGNLRFTVADTGIGIPADQREAIFGAFNQVDGAINRGFGGTGLGLTISRELATALGGTIHLESELGRGSTFRLDVPSRGGGLGA